MLGLFSLIYNKSEVYRTWDVASIQSINILQSRGTRVCKEAEKEESENGQRKNEN